MSKGSKKYRNLENDLDKNGYITTIRRHSKVSFDFVVNNEIVGQFRKRHSCNKRLIKLHNEIVNKG